MARVAVIGAGWAGCTAAVELAARGHAVTLFEAARTLGGRARQLTVNGLDLDNGQHILLGAYADTLRLMRKVGVDPNRVLLRLPLQMRYAADGMDLVAPRLPAPLHMLAGLLRARGLHRADKLALARFSTTARWMGWQLHVDCSVAELLDRFDQTDQLIRLMWRPLCIAALNTPPERASARVFLAVLRDSLGARRHASDMLLPRTDLSRLLPAHAARYVTERGGEVRPGVRIQGLRPAAANAAGKWELNGLNEGDVPRGFDGVVLATPPTQAADLLADHIDVAPLRAFSYEAITTCYLQYAPSVRLAAPFFALLDDAEGERWGQFVFDRGQLDRTHDGLLSVVISASEEAIALPQDALAQAVARQLARDFGRPELEHPRWKKVISEKRATFSCTPDLQRPENRTGLPGLVLAGDYTASDYPATLEAAVRSGTAAARLLAAAL